MGFHGATISSNAGLLVYRELDEVFDLTAGLNNLIEDTRTGKNIQHSLQDKEVEVASLLKFFEKDLAEV